MPAYLFTFRVGSSPVSNQSGSQTELDGTRFDDNHQRRLIDTAIDSQRPQGFRVFGMATDPTNAHVLVAWKDHRRADRLQALIKSSLSRGMNAEFGRREWLGGPRNQKRVRNRVQFDYLIEHYLQKHRGLVWTYADYVVRPTSLTLSGSCT